MTSLAINDFPVDVCVWFFYFAVPSTKCIKKTTSMYAYIYEVPFDLIYYHLFDRVLTDCVSFNVNDDNVVTLYF